MPSKICRGLFVANRLANQDVLPLFLAVDDNDEGRRRFGRDLMVAAQDEGALTDLRDVVPLALDEQIYFDG
jgi:hypothetical protein